MATFDDDYARLNLMLGTYTVPLKMLNLEWPPPERLWFDGHGMREATDADPMQEVLFRRSMSILTDEDRADMTHVARGAEYRYGPGVDA